MAEMINEYNILAGKLARKRPVGRPRRRWENNTRRDLREIGEKVWTAFIWLRIESNGGFL
jgi:hypothetical protein